MVIENNKDLLPYFNLLRRIIYNSLGYKFCIQYLTKGFNGLYYFQQDFQSMNKNKGIFKKRDNRNPLIVISFLLRKRTV